MINSIIPIICFFFILFQSCANEKKQLELYTLQPTDNYINLKLDTWTTQNLDSPQLIADSTGTEFIVFQHSSFPQLLFYNKATGKLAKRVTMPLEGPESIRRFIGFRIKKLNEIYLTETNAEGITLINSDGKLIKRFIGKTENGKTIHFVFDAFQIVGDSIYLGLYVDHENPPHIRLQQSPMCAIFNIQTHAFQTLPFTYYNLLKEENKEFLSISFKLCFNGNGFVYSFFNMDDIYVADMSHQHVRKLKIKSKYLPTLDFKMPKKSSISIGTYWKKLQKGSYGPFLYDPYRHLYYRVAFPPIESKEDISPSELMRYGSHTFTIMILNEDFQVLDEIMMPKDTYTPFIMFVDKDGLYISQSHFLNPNFNEDIIPLRRFEIISKK